MPSKLELFQRLDKVEAIAVARNSPSLLSSARLLRFRLDRSHEPVPALLARHVACLLANALTATSPLPSSWAASHSMQC